jgi:hypothetical protein
MSFTSRLATLTVLFRTSLESFLMFVVLYILVTCFILIQLDVQYSWKKILTIAENNQYPPTLNNKTNDTDKTKTTGTENQRTRDIMGNIHIPQCKNQDY